MTIKIVKTLASRLTKEDKLTRVPM